MFCAGQTDISDASRPIKDEEATAARTEGIEYTELQVATDALTVVVNNDLAIDCLTIDQLKTLWEPKARGQVTNWNQVDPSFPDEPIALFGPGTDSGTFDYFTDEINGEEGASRTDYSPSEDDNVIVQGVSGTPARSATSASRTTRRTPTRSRRSRSTAATAASHRPPRPRRTARTRRWPGRCSST